MKKYLDFVFRKEKKPISFDKILERIQRIKDEEESGLLTDSEIKEIQDLLNQEVESYEIYKTPSNNYILLSKTTFRKGRFYGDKGGAGRVSVTTSYVDKMGHMVVSEDKYPILKEQTNGAIDGDFVLIDLGGEKMKPRVDKILDRKLEYIPGEVYRVGDSYFVKPIDKRKQGITIYLEKEAIEGQRVAVSLKQQTSNDFYIGEIVKTFNHKDDPNEDILWEAFKHGVDNDFSEAALFQLEDIPTEVRDIDRIGREDLTNWQIFTIDGVDTKDMDDAVSCTINEKGNYILGVHITDIASIVPEDSPLDIEAFRKGNSFYLGGTVLPMFPHKISNGIGSLNPHVDRMTISCIMEITPDGEIVNYRISPTIIHSKLKMSYDKVNDILKNGLVDSEYEEFVDTLKNMQKLSLILKKRRILEGSSEFNRPELKVYRDNNKELIINLRTQDIGENLIEEFMVIANRVVDKELCDKGLPFVHRVHGTPNVERILEFLKLLNAINLPFDASPEQLASDNKMYQKLVDHISQSGRLSDLLYTEAIKCMSRAKYSSENSGHYGLATDYYCHFTSPVRRDADLTNQRILWDCLFDDSNLSQNVMKWRQKTPEIAERASHQEKVADDTEKDVLRMLCAEYMENHIGEEFDGTIINLSGDCMVVQLDNLIEGTVRVKDLEGRYVYSPTSYSLVSLNDRENYYIGDQLHLRLKSSSKETRKIDFDVLYKISETSISHSDEIHEVVKQKVKRDTKKVIV